MQLEQAQQKVQEIRDAVARVVVGQEQVIKELITSLLAGGHALLEGVPGTAKTLLARVLARVCGSSFNRIQFTPDLMPSDILGVNIYNTATGAFTFRPGPIFTDIILGDEINRAPAKTQSALLEAMAEKQVTIDGETRAMSPVFSVYATQNPIEFEGTYPLPEAEVDRFMLKIVIRYPDEQAEEQILQQVDAGFDAEDLSTADIPQLLNRDELKELRNFIRTIRLQPSILRYIACIIRASRTLQQITLGASPRAGVMLIHASKAAAIINGRDFVTPDDVKMIAPAVLRHRLILLPEIEIEGRSTDDCIQQILSQIEVPRD